MNDIPWWSSEVVWRKTAIWVTAFMALVLMALTFDTEWLQANPLTVADLEREKRLLAQAGYELGYD